MKKIFWNTIIIINFYLILFFWYKNSNYLLFSNNPGDFFIALGRLSGLLAEFFILIQLLLISRFSSIEREYGFDKLISIHKKVGFSLGIFIISHPLFLTIGYAKSNNISFIKQFLNFQNSWEGVFGATLAFIIIILISIFSIKKIRSKVPYEVWYFAHLPLYIAFAIAFGHQINTGDMTNGWAILYWFILNIIVFLILISYRFIKPLYYFYKHKFIIEKIVKENKDVYSIYISGKNMNQFKFQEGQFATLIFLQKNMFFHHPFSFSNAFNGKNIRLTIKSSGDFTSKINNLKTGTHVWIDGPVGTFTLQNAINKKYLFIAGGIGISPIFSLIKSIKDTSDAFLLYSNKTEENVVFKDEIIQSGINTSFFYTDQGIQNRIDIKKIEQVCPDYKKRDIYICGPTKMTINLVKNLKSNGLSSEQIHFEKFDY